MHYQSPACLQPLWNIVLSGHQITDVNEIAKMKANGYHYINYETLFNTRAEWWAWQGWDLGISFNDNGNNIGIESSYSDPQYDERLAAPHIYLGDFHIYITVWNKKCFTPYRDELKKLYPDCWIDDNPEGAPNRVYLHLPVIKDNDHEEIIKKLTEYYNTMKDITDRIK